MRAWSQDRTDRQWQGISPQKAHHASGALQLPGLDEDKLEASPHLFIGIENDCPRPVVSEPGRQGQPEFAASRFLALSLMKAHANLVEFRLAHEAGQSEQQAIMIDSRVIRG